MLAGESLDMVVTNGALEGSDATVTRADIVCQDSAWYGVDAVLVP